jgi:hypothetical protein
MRLSEWLALRAECGATRAGTDRGKRRKHVAASAFEIQLCEWTQSRNVNTRITSNCAPGTASSSTGISYSLSRADDTQSGEPALKIDIPLPPENLRM